MGEDRPTLHQILSRPQESLDLIYKVIESPVVLLLHLFYLNKRKLHHESWKRMDNVTILSDATRYIQATNPLSLSKLIFCLYFLINSHILCLDLDVTEKDMKNVNVAYHC